MTQQNTLPATDPMVTVREIAAELRLSVPTIYKHLEAGTFPPPVRIGRSVRWRRSTIDAIKTDGLPQAGQAA
jgi:excisionase family DNA binding protein